MLADVTQSLIDVATDPAAGNADLQAAAQSFLAASSQATDDDRNQALRRLGLHFNVKDIRCTAFLALVSLELLQRGCDAANIAEPLTDQLRHLLELSATLAEACPRQMPHQDDERDPAEMFGEVWQQVAATMPEHKAAWESLRKFWPPAIMLFSFSPQLRAAARPLRPLAAKISDYHEGGHWLRLMLSVLECEPVLILEPKTSLGLAGHISGVVDNFQLNVLLMDAFPNPGLFARRRVSRRVAAVARGEGPQQTNDTVTATWNLYTWEAIQPDFTLPNPNDPAFWIWNEGSPEDIPLFEGRRVVLLGPPSYPRYWQSQRMFNRLRATLHCERTLTKSEVCGWLQRMLAAKSPC